MPKMEGNTLVGWDCEEEDKRVLFMEHLYKCDNRHFPAHPKHGTYTGLWQSFCLNEAGKAMRDDWFMKMEAIHRDLQTIQHQQNLEHQQPFIPTFSD